MVDFNSERRRFLKATVDTVMGASAVALIGVMFGPLAYKEYQDRYNEKKENDEIEKLKKEIKNSYGIDISFSTEDFDKFFAKQNAEADKIASKFLMRKLLENILTEISKYPPDLLSVYVNTFVLVYGGRFTLYGRQNGLNGIADPNDGKVGISQNLFATYTSVLMGKATTFWTINHEIAHCIARTIDHEDWKKEFGDSHVYFFNFETPRPGFARGYGERNPIEDIATCVELLFHPGLGRDTVEYEFEGKKMKTAAREHPLVQKKLEYLRAYPLTT